MKRVLVTGPNGFIGRHCLPLLLERGYETHGLVPEGGMQLDIPDVQWHVMDLLDPNHIQALVRAVAPTHLLHFAWVTKPREYWTSLENLRWLQASLDLLQAFRLAGGRRVLMAGTCAEYDWRYRYLSDQLTPLNPSTLYGTCKKSLYEILMSVARQGGISAAWGRIFFLYGPYEHPSRLVPFIINSLLDGRRTPCTQGTQIRDYLHVEDVASAFAALLDSELEGAVNIASGEPVAIRTIISRISEKLGRPELLQFGAIPMPESEPPLLVADADRLKQGLRWVPTYGLEVGLDQTIDWWRKRRTSA